MTVVEKAWPHLEIDRLRAEVERLRAALEEIRDEHAEFDDLAYNIAIRALKEPRSNDAAR